MYNIIHIMNLLYFLYGWMSESSDSSEADRFFTVNIIQNVLYSTA